MNYKDLDIAQIRAQLTNGESPGHKANFCFSGFEVEVRTNSSGLIDDLRNYFKEFPSKGGKPNVTIEALETPEPRLDLALTQRLPDSGKTRIKEEFADLADGRLIRKRETGVHLLFGSGQYLAVGPVKTYSNQVINFINNQYMHWFLDQGYILAHAAGIQWKGKGLCIAGYSGMGKSTLSLNFMSRGATFVSNDRLLLKKTGDSIQMRGVPKHPRINPGTIIHNPDLANLIGKEKKRAYSQLPPEELWGLEEKYDAIIDECFGPNKYALEGELDLVAVFNWAGMDKPPEVHPVDLQKRPELLQSFIKSLGLYYSPETDRVTDEPGVEDYLKHLADCPAVEITGGKDFQIVSETCLEILETGNLTLSN